MPDMMKTNEQIICYLTDTYQPEAVIVYGSFADGSANEHSDFDALVIADHAKAHDNAVIGGTVLDVFVYPPDVFRAEYDPEDFVQIFDGRIILDKNGENGGRVISSCPIEPVSVTVLSRAVQ